MNPGLIVGLLFAIVAGSLAVALMLALREGGR